MKALLLTAAVSFALTIFLSVPLEARADTLDDEAAGIQQQIQVLQARLVYLQTLKNAGYTSLPVATVAVPVTAGACSQAASVGSCGANASMGAASSGGFFERWRERRKARRGSGKCGG